jgi:hypothetical protein
MLIAIAIIKNYEEELLKCKRLKDFCEIMERKNKLKTHSILKEVVSLKEKYFGQSKGILDEIKNIFNTKPLEPVLFEFYKQESHRLDVGR